MAYNHMVKREDGKHYNSDSSFRCGNYKSGYCKEPDNRCTSHYIKADTLYSLVRLSIKSVIDMMLQDRTAFLEKLQAIADEHQADTSEDARRQREKAEQRIRELDVLIKNLYEANTSGKIPDRQFTRLISQYDDEQLALEDLIKEMDHAIAETEDTDISVNRFKALVERYLDCKELTTTMINEFINKILVYEADKSTGKRTQRIDIYFNFIGVIELPQVPLLMQEEEAERKKKPPLDPEEAERIRIARSQRINELQVIRAAKLKEAAKGDAL